MVKFCSLTYAVIALVLALSGAVWAQGPTLEYPYYLLDAYDADDNGWTGIDVNGLWIVPVDPEQWLVGPPPSELSAVTLPTDHWVELKFLGELVDGSGDDIFLIEHDPVGEQARVFITDGAGQEYLIGKAAVPDTGGPGLTEIRFNFPGIALPFEPCAIRILGIDLRGGSPGFDLANVRARTHITYGNIAWNPRPPDGAENVPHDAILSWSPGRSAQQHTVYFGTSLSDVNESASPVSSPPQPQDETFYDPCGLDLGRTYYWRIDEVNEADANSPWIGNVWSFTVTDYLTVDDFESYNDTDKRLDNIWRPGGDGLVDLSTDPCHWGQQAMIIDYYNQWAGYSEAVRTFTMPQNWAAGGATVLKLFFHGRADNDADEQMYIVLGDGDVNAVVLYNGDANNISDETWHTWRIDLPDFTNVNLNNIRNIVIGFGDGTPAPFGTGIGIVFFDDIRLYRSTCLEESRPDADFNADCIVDFQDLQVIADTWLDSGYYVYPVVEPNTPLAWYEFENNTLDSAGSAHGDPCGNPTYATGVYGRAISLDGYSDSVNITGAAELFSRISTKITIAFWQYGEDSPHHTDTVCCSNYTYAIDGPAKTIVDGPAIAINLGCWRSPGRYNWDCGYPWSFDNRLSGNHQYKSQWSGHWNHWAFIKDTDAGTDPRKGTMKIFLNAVLYDSRTDANSTISSITSFEIGSGWYGGYDGLIDDFRIYDYALSQPEIAYVATNGTGIFDLPVMSPADLYLDNRIDFKDLAVFANSWLDNQLYP